MKMFMYINEYLVKKTKNYGGMLKYWNMSIISTIRNIILCGNFYILIDINKKVFLMYMTYISLQRDVIMQISLLGGTM